MRASRRSSPTVDLASYNVADQQRELARISQEKADREFALQLLQGEIEQQQQRVGPSRPAREAEAATPAAPEAVDPTPAPTASSATPAAVPQNPIAVSARPAPGPVRNTSRRSNSEGGGPAVATNSRGQPTTVARNQAAAARAQRIFQRNFIYSPFPAEPSNRRGQVTNQMTQERYAAISSVLSDSEDSSSDEESDTSVDSSNDDSDFFEPVVNNIQQELLGNDRDMYARELQLSYPADAPLPTTSAAADAALNPPPRVGIPNSKWGDCAICFESPIEPKGCAQCMKLIGCARCINEWQSSSSDPSCPLCRRKWKRTPDVLTMNTIDRRQRARLRQIAEREAAASVTPAARVLNPPVQN